MPRVQLPFVSGFYVSQEPTFLDKRVVNAYPVIPLQGGISDRSLFRTPGTLSFATTTKGTSRGSIVFKDGTPYFVLGNSLVSVSSAGAITDHGTITGTADVSMASNGINIAIQVPKGDSYFYTPSSGVLEKNTNAAFLGQGQALSVTFQDSFYIYNTDSVIFSSSSKATNDGKDFNALDFSDPEISPDKVIRVHSNHNQLYVFGENTTEVYRFNSALTAFPFQTIPGAMIQKGCSAQSTVIDFDNSFVFFGGDAGERPAVWRGTGSSAQKISTSSVDQLFQSKTEVEIANATAFAYSQNGHYFAVFTIGDNTLVYDAAASAIGGSPQWHERQSGVTNGTGFKAWRSQHGVEAYGKILVGDTQTGNIGELSFDTTTEYGAVVERYFTTRPFIERVETIFSHEVELLMQTGVGDGTTTDPQIRLDYSDDMGRTWSNEIPRSMGKVGEYNTRVIWSRLGSIPRSRVLRFKMSDPVEFSVYGLFANAQVTTGG